MQANRTDLLQAMTTPSRLSFLFLLSLLAAAAASAAAAGLSPAGTVGGRQGALLGGYRPIENVSDPHIVEIGRYAVSEHNRQSGQSLAFLRVVSGRQQVVAGTNYDVVIEARDGAAPGKYEAVVYERAWESYRSLTSFKPMA